MTLLTVIQTATKELGLPVPTTVINNSDATVKQLLALAEREGKEVRTRWKWPQLNREFTFTLVNNQANYAFNDDYDYQASETHWDRTNKRELFGPMSESEWQVLKSGIATAGINRRYRVKGIADKQIYIDPTPTATDTLVFEYQSANWIRPKTWVTATAFAAGAYCFNDGNWYSTTAGGTTGATAPTHTTGSASDGTVSWIYSSALYETFVADSDISLLDENLLCLGLQWRFRRDKGLEYAELRKDSEAAWSRAATARRGSRVLSLAPKRTSYLITSRNIPDTGYS